MASLPSCVEKKSTNPTEVYRLWSGTQPPKEIKVLNGKYWQSAHWTKEYILFLELEAGKKFWEDLKKSKNLIIDTKEKPFTLL